VHPWVEVAVVVVRAGSVERERESCSMDHSRGPRVEVDASVAVRAVRASSRIRIARIGRQTGRDCMTKASCVSPENRSSGRYS